MSSSFTTLNVADIDLQWADHFRNAAEVGSGKVSVIPISGTWEEWKAASPGAAALLDAAGISIAICTTAPGHAAVPLPVALAACDLRVLVSGTVAPGQAGGNRDWNRIFSDHQELRAWLQGITVRIHKLGPAALTCAQTLRLTARTPDAQALVIESMAYAMLQGSAAHRQWLAGRSS